MKNIAHKHLTIRIGLWQLNLLMSLLFISVFNIYFWKELTAILKPSSPGDYLFILSVFLLLVLTVNLILNLFTSQKTYKILYVLIFTLSAISFYYISQYNIVIDKEMIRNVIETNPSEARDLIGFALFIYVFVLAVLPILFIYKTHLNRVSLGKLFISKAKITVISLIAIALTIYVSYPSLASLARGNRHLSHLVIPTNFIFAGISYIDEQFKSAHVPFNDLSQQAQKLQTLTADAKNVTLIIVGETARADRFSINGYHRPTSPKLQKRNLVNFKQTSSCGTSTAVSLPCLFSHLGRKTYNHKVGGNSANLLDFFKHVGIDVQWRDNNTGCKGICDRTSYLDMSHFDDPELCSTGECFDEILLKGLRDQIKNNSRDQVIVLHQKGSHGPAYYLRYPPEFEVFKPTCQTVQLQKCSEDALNNSYDNTILYTDFFIDQAIQLLEDLPKSTITTLIYIADHGESLGENNLYLHGTPYLIAPESQTHVPFFYWRPTKTNYIYQVDINCLKNEENHPFSHDNLFHSLLGYMNIASEYYNKELDVFAPCRTASLTHLAQSNNKSTQP